MISSPYLTSVGGGGGPGQNRNGTGGAIEFLQERDSCADVRGKIGNPEVCRWNHEQQQLSGQFIGQHHIRNRWGEFTESILWQSPPLWK